MTSRRDPNRRLLRFAREMRHQPTDAERKLWSLLRDRRLGGFKFRRQHPVAGYIVDFSARQPPPSSNSTAVSILNPKP